MKWIFIALTVIFLYGCKSDNNSQSINQQIDNLQQQVKSLQEQISNLEKDQQEKISDLKKAFVDLYFTYFTDKKDKAYFTPASEGYIVINSNVGYFLVSLNKLTKYADGYKVTFEIGNPGYLLYKGLTVMVEWGVAYPKNSDYEAWEKTLHSKEIRISNPILPGTWNTVSVILSPATSRETGYITLAIQADQIILHRENVTSD